MTSTPSTPPAGLVLALYATNGLDELLSNALDSILDVGIAPEQIVVGCPADAMAAISSVVRRHAATIHVVMADEAATSVAGDEGYADFGSARFGDISWRKISFVRRLLDDNAHVIYADLDITWIRNPVSYLSEAAAIYPMAFQTEGLGRFPPALCCGFFSLARSDRTLAFLDAMLALHASQTHSGKPLDDQAACQHLIETDSSWMRDIYPLPESLFLNGLAFRNLVGGLRSPSPMEEKLSPFLFHANWTIGLDNKQKLLAAARDWLLAASAAPRAPTGNAADGRPRVSVLIPLGDARIDPAGNVAAWTEGQACDPRDFEVVAVADNSDPAMVEAIAQVLRPHDRLLSCAAADHFMSRLAHAANHARGEILFFAEHHSLPDAGCVGAIIDYFDERKWVDGAALIERQHPFAPNDELNRQWFAEMDWLARSTFGNPKLKAGSCAMRRDRYVALGGLDGRYGLFADRLLTVKAAIAGMKVGKIPISGLSHFAPTMHDHQKHIMDYAAGECAYRAEGDAAFCERYFGHEHVWANRQMLDAALARTDAAILARQFVHDLRSARPNAAYLARMVALVRELAQRLSLGLLGPRAVVATAHLAAQWSQLRAIYPGGNLPKQWIHYRRAWERIVRYVRLRYASDHRETSPPIAMTPDHWPIAEIPETQRIGFHGHEELHGTPFRWTEPIAKLRIARPPGHVRVLIETVAGRGNDVHYVAGVFWGSRRIPRVDVSERGISFDVDIVSARPQWLTIVSYPLPAPRDTRKLGFSMSGLAFAVK